MDPTQAISVAEKLAAGNAQTVLAFVAVGFALMAGALGWMLRRSWQDHLAEVRACAAQTLDLTLKKIASDDKLADALTGVERIVDTALATMRKQ